MVKDRTANDCQSVVIVVDFSKNYLCKRSLAVQYAHFGASNNQICLHTDVIYVESRPITFCSVSKCTIHDPFAIWAHLSPELKFVRTNYPNAKFVNFFSNRQTTQYCHKQHFQMLSYLMYDEGFNGGTWNFFEAGHGKNAADAIDRILKCTAGRAVDHGIEVNDIEDFIKAAAETSVILFQITSNDIFRIQSRQSNNLKAINGTMKLHQVQLISRGQLCTRNYSCFCQQPEMCNCYSACDVAFPALLDEVLASETASLLKKTQ